MKRSLVLVALLTVALTPALGEGNMSQNAPNAADESAVRAIVQKCVDGWNKGSGEAFAAPFAADSDYVVVNGMHHKGRRENASNHQRIFDTFYKGTRLWVQIKSVRFLRPDVAVMHTVSQIQPAGSDAPPEPKSIQTWTVSKHGDEWLVDAFHNTPLEPAGPPPKP